MTRLVERSYLSILLERDPDYYARTRNTNRVEYKMSNGREFLGHDIYSNYFPLDLLVYIGPYPVIYDGALVSYEAQSLADVDQPFEFASLTLYGGIPVTYGGLPVGY